MKSRHAGAGRLAWSFILFSISFSLIASNASDNGRLLVDLEKPVGVVDKRFLSFALDTAQVDGGKWWDSSGQTSGGRGSHTVPPFDFSPPRLRALTRALAPAYLRIGGSEADLAYYDMTEERSHALPKGFESRLTAAQYDSVYRFTRDTGLELFFDLNAGSGNRPVDHAWDPANARVLMSYAQASGQWPEVWEFGNEVNAFWLTLGLGHQVCASQYAQDFELARETLRSFVPGSLLAGPASAYWPVLGESVGLFFTQMGAFLRRAPEGSVDVVSWHYYPTESSRCPVAVRRTTLESFTSPKTLNEIRRWAKQVRMLRDAYQPQAQLWLGETASAQCGGQAGVSDRYASGFWWLDQLGTAAQTGHSLVIRQTLSGSDYGMITEGSWEPRPDYWNSLLWKKIMGTKVLGLPGFDGNGTTRVYAHCAAPGAGAPTGAVAMLVMNLDRSQELKLPLSQFSGQRWEEYGLTADSLSSSELKLNRTVLVAGADGELPDMDSLEHGASQTGAPELQVPPLSYSFVVFPDARAPACL